MRRPDPHAILHTLALLALLAPLPWRGAAWAQVSPGPLAAPHAALEGATQCFRCHVSGGSRAGLDARCLACHTEVGWMRTRQRGLHAKVTDRACAACHPDHGGRGFSLVAWDEGAAEKFDHRRSGHALEGKHASLECRACHKPALQKSGAVPLLRRKDHAASWFGLETACASCHADPHRRQLGAACTDCHGQTAWKPAPGFDHARSAFPLAGEHAKVACAKCHANPATAKARDAKGQVLAQWKPLPHADCVSCHRDPHEGRFAGACAKCHVTAGWRQVNRQGFNHDVTRYPLRGRHTAVDCASCHTSRAGRIDKPKFARCTDCHADAHAGTATRAGLPVDCASCHAVAGFDRSLYTVTDHARARYPLAGRHAATACEKCHPKLSDRPANVAALGTARVLLRPAFAACTACHADPHRGRYEPGGARARAKGCLECHALAGFRPTRFDGALHATSRFALTGAHRAVPCRACHAELDRPAAEGSLRADSSRVRVLAFENPKRRCAECHATPHGEQFAHRRDAGACEGCHVDAAFSPASRFDHNRDSDYRLEGAHKRTPCASCHPPRREADGRTSVLYRPLSPRCESCHAGGVSDSLKTTPRRRRAATERPHANPTRPASGGRP